jgi:hypothetical protein
MQDSIAPLLLVSQLNMTHGNFKEMQDLTNK